MSRKLKASDKIVTKYSRDGLVEQNAANKSERVVSNSRADFSLNRNSDNGKDFALNSHSDNAESASHKPRRRDADTAFNVRADNPTEPKPAVYITASDIHETAHAMLHDRDIKSENIEPKDRNTREVEAESIAYTICQHYGIDTSEYSFAYVASWSENKELPELKASLKTIHDTAAELIKQIDEQLELQQKEREQAQNKQNEQEKPHEDIPVPLIPVYMESAKYAYDHGEGDLWKNSFRLNKECRDFIRDNITSDDHFNYNLKSVADDLATQFGVERAMYVIARNIKSREGDGRFTRAVKSRAEQFQFPDMQLEYDNSRNYICNTHSVLLNRLFELLEDKEKMLSIMPDHTTVEARNEYGYTSDIMIPMDKSKALELFDEGQAIYLLYPDNSEGMALERRDIEDFNGMFGIERADWLDILEQGALPSEVDRNPENREAEFLFGDENSFAIYQLDDREDLRDIHFENLKNIGGVENVRKENYNMVYSDTIDIEPTDDIYEVLNGIYEQFNIDRPDDFTGHSLSVSDIIAIRRDGDVEAYFVDSYGFEGVEHFYGENKQEIVWDNDKQTYQDKITEALPEPAPERLEDRVISGNATRVSAQNQRRSSEPKQKPSVRKKLNGYIEQANKQNSKGKDKPKNRNKGHEV